MVLLSWISMTNSSASSVRRAARLRHSRAAYPTPRADRACLGQANAERGSPCGSIRSFFRGDALVACRHRFAGADETVAVAYRRRGISRRSTLFPNTDATSCGAASSSSWTSLMRVPYPAAQQEKSGMTPPASWHRRRFGTLHSSAPQQARGFQFGMAIRRL
jgi:hypothetical protein